MPTSRTRKEIKYSFTRSLIGEKLARMEIHDRVVVSTTSATDRPSAPSLYWIPKSGIQSTTSLNWKDPAADATTSRPGRKARTSQRLTTHVASAKNSAVPRIAARLRRGRNAITSAPARGRKMIRLRIGKVERSTAVPLPRRDDEVGAGHDDQADRDAQGVVLDVPGLDPPQPAAGAHGDPPDPVHRAIHHGPVEPPERIRRAPADHHEQEVVEVVEPPLVEGRPVQEARRARRRGDRLAGPPPPAAAEEPEERERLRGLARRLLRAGEDRVQPLRDDRVAERQPQPQAQEHRRDGQQDQRHGHRP